MSNKPLDSVTITTVWSYFWRVCREMRETVERTATNVLIVTLHDLAYTIYDAEGNALAVPEGIPHRLLSPKLGVQHIKEKFGDDIHPGDVFLANTPDDGAAHLPDWVYIRPIFCEGELTFFAVMGVHVADNGGAQPGSNFMSFDNISEGFNIPLSRIVKAGVWNNEVFDVIMANNRQPDLMRRESSACIGSLAIGDKRLVELCEKYGRDTVVACTHEMMDRAEAAVRKQIESWPDGTWYAEASADSDGKDLTKPITVRASLTVKGSDLYFDFSETDPETEGMLNIHDYMTYSDCCCNSFLFFGKDLLTYHNEGSCRPIHMTTKPGTLVDASRTAKIAAGVALTGGLVNEVIQNLLSQVLPEKAIAPYSRQVTSNIITLGKPGVFVSFSASAGAGAVYGADGYQSCAAGSTLGNIGKTNVEDEMQRFAWEYKAYEFVTDKHGAGTWRGAPGIVWAIENKAGRCLHQTGSWDGFKTQAKGLQGGQDAPLNVAHIERADGSVTPFESKDFFTNFGDVEISVTGGGAGVGDPAKRDPKAVEYDVLNELVSIQFAKDVYKVVIDPATLKVDEAATAALRGA